ncbi:UNVERIFIED_CONTAM: PX domain-containing protein EREX [Sesamum radiatum]|uniref:PX domain-containing protein EREX n=1 Tax=Sesamum radiatum TaxID=300843 RepID=A0AAW2PIM3_SESRA
MNLYGLDYSLFDLGFADPTLIETLSGSNPMIIDRRNREREEENLLKLSNSILKNIKRNSSPPRRRHDGTSPLPLGMDWSPAPLNWRVGWLKKFKHKIIAYGLLTVASGSDLESWPPPTAYFTIPPPLTTFKLPCLTDGPNTIWPHDFHTGWSYCVTVPCWSILSESEGSEPVVFYRVQVGLQSPEGVTTTRGVLRRFNDFLKLSSDLKRSFRKKKLPPAPPKGLLRMKSRTLLEEVIVTVLGNKLVREITAKRTHIKYKAYNQDSSQRRRSLEDWMANVLSDIDFSRSAPVACFLELEAAVRSSFHESIPNVNLSCNSGSLADPFAIHSDVSVPAGTSALASNYGNDSTDRTSDIGSALCVEERFSEFGNGNPISDDNLSSLAEATANEAMCENKNVTLSKDFSEGKEKYLQKFHDERSNLDKIHIDASDNLPHHDIIENSPDLKNSPMVGHAKGLLRESPLEETSTSNQISNLWEDQDNGTSSKYSESGEASEALHMLASSGLRFSHDTLSVLPMDEQQKVLTTMQQRLGTSKTDTGDLIARLHQELALRQYLTTKVKDLETELESTKKSDRENLEQALSIERERCSQMQCNVEELRRKCMEMELRLKAELDEKAQAESTETSIIKENEALPGELDCAREQLKNLQICHGEVDLKSESDVKLLVREVKSLQNSQSELRQELDRVAKERTEFETRLQEVRTKRERIDAVNAKLLHECQILRSQLAESCIDFLVEQEKLKMDPSGAVDILTTLENRIGLFLTQAQLLAQDVANPVTSSSAENDDVMATDYELRKMLTDLLIDNVILRQQVNLVTRCALNMVDVSPNNSEIVKDEASTKLY